MNYYDNHLPSIIQLFGEADDTLFRSILTKKQHVLQSFYLKDVAFLITSEIVRIAGNLALTT